MILLLQINLISCDDCQIIKKIENWELELKKENNLVEETTYLDWDGYKKIDAIQMSIYLIN